MFYPSVMYMILLECVQFKLNGVHDSKPWGYLFVIQIKASPHDMTLIFLSLRAYQDFGELNALTYFKFNSFVVSQSN